MVSIHGAEEGTTYSVSNLSTAVEIPGRKRRNGGSRSWSELVWRGASEERACAVCCGLHDRLGQQSAFHDVDPEVVRLIFELSDLRDNVMRLQTETPDPGCTLFGCMFDVRNRLVDSHFLISAITVFSSQMCPHASYQLFFKKGTCWTHVHTPHTWTPTNVNIRVTAGGDPTGDQDSCLGYSMGFYETVLELTTPILLQKCSSASIYVHSDASWGAVGYKAIDMLSPMARPGAVTASGGGLEILTGTFGMAPEPFVDISGIRCAVSCIVEADAIEARFGIFEEGHREDMEINEYGRWQQ